MRTRLSLPKLFLLCCLASVWVDSPFAQAPPSPQRESNKWLRFSGGLQCITQDELTIRLADGLLIIAQSRKDGGAGEQLVSQRRFGDQLEITCEFKNPPYDRGLESDVDYERRRQLKVKTVRFLRPPSGEEWSKESACRAWREKGNLLKGLPERQSPEMSPPPVSATDVFLRHARQVNLEHVAKLSSFVVDETARLYSSKSLPPNWEYVYTAESELTVRGLRTVHQRVLKDGRPWPKPFEALPGLLWKSKFGVQLKPLFDPLCPTTLMFSGSQDLRGRHVLDL